MMSGHVIFKFLRVGRTQAQVKHGIKAEAKRTGHVCRPDTNNSTVRAAKSYVNAFDMGNENETSLQSVDTGTETDTRSEFS